MPEMENVFEFLSLDQVNAETKKFDEHKSFLGFASRGQVERTYHAAFSDGKGPQRLGHLREMPVAEFKRWLENGDTTKPIREVAA